MENKDIMNGKNLFAYAYLDISNGFGTFTIDIPVNYTDSSNPLVVSITAQIGSECYDDFNCEFYGQKIGIRTMYSDLITSINELAKATKLFKKIKANMEKINDQFGHPHNFAEFANRALIAAGCKHLIYTNNELSLHGSYIRACGKNVKVGNNSKQVLERLEQYMIGKFTK